jgi:TolB-like protein/Flp pilus assembly protein TadD
MIPESFGRFRIIEKLNEGGMGTVYLARDESLGRKVAIKTIRQELADAMTRRRLWREARAAASVNHPNVCQIYEVGEVDGDLFLAMELLEGQTLAERLAAGAISLKSALAIAQEILAALDAIHARGFVHRDLKPSNIFCTHHGVKLLDFGVVLLPDHLRGTESKRLTQPGMMVGTPAFMAPEQWNGRDVEPAADLFAVGAILFEMITGTPPFQGKTVLDIYNAIVRDPAPTLTGGPAIEALDRIVQSALAKQPEDRPRSALAMSAELEAVAPLVADAEAVRAQQVQRLLIPPLRLLKADEEIDFLCFSLADALVSSLSGRDGLVVKTGGAKYNDAEPDFGAIARETDVGLVLLGTLLRAGPQLWISARLVEVPDGAVIWSETKKAPLDDMFTLQDELAAHIADSLAMRLGSSATVGGSREVPATGKAYEYYLRANQLSYNFGMLPAARDLYRAALEEDPNFASAWARLGRVYRVMAKYGHGGAEYLDLAEQAFVTALELNPNLATAHNLFAYYEIEELARPQDALVRLLKHARNSPTNPDLLSGLVLACRFCGLFEASLEADRRARRLDPSVATSVAYTHWMRGDYEAAMRTDDEDMRWIHHYSLPMLGRVDEALASLRQIAARTPRQVERDMLISTQAALEKDVATCVAATRRVLQSNFHDPEGLYFEARNAVYLGELDLGCEILERVVNGGLWCDEKYANDPWLKPLRATGRLDPFIELARTRRLEASRCYRDSGGELLLGSLGPEFDV